MFYEKQLGKQMENGVSAWMPITHLDGPDLVGNVTLTIKAERGASMGRHD